MKKFVDIEPGSFEWKLYIWRLKWILYVWEPSKWIFVYPIQEKFVLTKRWKKYREMMRQIKEFHKTSVWNDKERRFENP